MITLGWREYLSLPELGLDRIKAKIDTGARSSCLHAAFVEPFDDNGTRWVRFGLHPDRNRPEQLIESQAPVVDVRRVADSGGHREDRYFIRTPLRLGDESWDIEINLTGRETMLFPMLLGRTAMVNRALVNPAQSFLLGR